MAKRDARFWNWIAKRYARQKVFDSSAWEKSLDAIVSRLPADAAVMEFGCGTGSTALRLAPHAGAILATDLSPAMIAIAKEKLAGPENSAASAAATVTFRVGSAEDVSLSDGPFDVIIAMNTLHLLRDLPRTLAHVRNLLKPGGIFISKTPCLADSKLIFRALAAIARTLPIGLHVRSVSGVSLEQMLADADFVAETVEYHADASRDPRPFIVARRAS